MLLNADSLITIPPKKLQSADYYVAWIAPVSNLELLPSRLIFDEEYNAPDYDIIYDDNVYICGIFTNYNIVIAICAPGIIGNVNAGRVTGSIIKNDFWVKNIVILFKMLKLYLKSKLYN
ncbi:hypothetical protein PoMZ_02584 [Pyricularia oryzae]|uniref:Uncharacterized protein n=1 Tax=Pyricularia oryzae TaxID=318829 RepID=A0A4P7NBL8_PYROR|nr:hypothetical protein PoMZ_02584 [Pyricularia oryzae]